MTAASPLVRTYSPLTSEQQQSRNQRNSRNRRRRDRDAVPRIRRPTLRLDDHVAARRGEAADGDRRGLRLLCGITPWDGEVSESTTELRRGLAVDRVPESLRRHDEQPGRNVRGNEFRASLRVAVEVEARPEICGLRDDRDLDVESIPVCVTHNRLETSNGSRVDPRRQWQEDALLDQALADGVAVGVRFSEQREKS